jgi:hypothetical protein
MSWNSGRCLIFHWRNSLHAAQGRLILEVSRSRTMTHHSRYDSSGRGIGPSQRPLADSTQHLKEANIPVPGGGGDSNPQPQQAIGSRPSTYTTRPLGTAECALYQNTSKWPDIILFDFKTVIRLFCSFTQLHTKLNVTLMKHIVCEISTAHTDTRFCAVLV